MLALHSGAMLATHSGPFRKVANFPPEQVANFSPESVANFRSESTANLPRNTHKYFNADGSDNELGKAADKSMESAVKELTKFGTVSNDKYIDWLVY
jgi:hypothetical protein